MRKETVARRCLALLLFAAPLSGAQERTLTLGGAAGWDAVQRRAAVQELSQVRRFPALALSSALPERDADLDLSLSFDQASAADFADARGNYRLSAAPGVSAVAFQRARHGSGAALFSESPLTITPLRGALLAPGKRLGDFSIEFWIFPANLESGEQILSWTAGRRSPRGEYVSQRIRCLITRNRMEWTFSDLFSSADDARRLSVSLTSGGTILPKTWSHHLLRFESGTGLLEYLVDGRLEALTYTTAGGREGGEVFLPVVGEEGALVLGSRFTGMMDEFRIYRRYAEDSVPTKYPLQGGRMETKFLDLGTAGSTVLRLEAFGDRYAASSGADIRFFMRAADNPYRWNDDESTWIPVEPALPLEGRFRGRWVQVAAVLYPSGDGERTPFLDELRIHYLRKEPPAPPSLVSAAAADGAVELSWRPSVDPDAGGYLIYYGVASGTYFGTDALLGASPLDAGNRTSIRIDGLRNGTLYYFAVAAYDRADPRAVGAFSREVAARPVRMMQ